MTTYENSKQKHEKNADFLDCIFISLVNWMIRGDPFLSRDRLSDVVYWKQWGQKSGYKQGWLVHRKDIVKKSDRDRTDNKKENDA